LRLVGVFDLILRGAAALVLVQLRAVPLVLVQLRAVPPILILRGAAD
jgi:hypothetical protein